MRFPQPLKRGALLRRYKRFLADIALEDFGEATAHAPNPGAMLGLCDPGLTVWCSPQTAPGRKLAWTWELVEVDGGLVGVNTQTPNRLVAEALKAKVIAELSDYGEVKAEVRMGEASRVDFLLRAEGRADCWLEVKNCHLKRRDGLAEFPDCVAARSAKHLRELEHRVADGDRAAVLFVVQRTDCDRFSACADLDPAFAAALEHAADAGVEVLVYRCAITVEGVTVTKPLPWMRL